jgi:hypothetical protein
MGRRKRKTKERQAISPTPTPTRWTRKATTPYLLKKKNDKVMAIKVNKHANTRGVKQVWVPKEIISTMKSTKKV